MPTNALRVAVALAQPPLPEGNAAGRAGLALMRGLSAHGVTLAAVAARRTFATAADQLAAVPADVQVQVVDQLTPDAASAVARIAAQARRLARPRGGLAGDPFRRAVLQAASASDVLHLEELETGWAGVGSRVPALLHVHYLTRLDRDPGRLATRTWRDVHEFMAAERRLARRHRHLVASSPVVAGQLRLMAPAATVDLIPLPLDPADYAQASVDAPVVGLIGTASWAPTRDALERLLGRIWPEVMTQVPDSSLLIAGRGSAATSVPSSLTSRVRVLGEVASSVGFFQSIGVLVYPVTRGSGPKVKVLEAMACGVPVVTTPSGAEGAPESDGLLVAQGDDDIVAATVTLLRDTAERKERGAAARRDVIARHGPKAATAPLVALLDALASR